VLVACEQIEIEPQWAFVVTESDTETLDIIKSWPERSSIYLVDDEINTKRLWNSERYEHMVDLRNKLLLLIRRLQPKYFLSLDSDILVHPDLIKNLIETAENHLGAIAVGGKTYMTVGDTNHPSYGMWDKHFAVMRREEFGGIKRVDIIMAIKLMTKVAYKIDYRPHNQGEDLGWSEAARESGQLWFDGRVASKHLMSEYMLDQVDKRCGF
jgi:hypothetical protein